ncbi:TonB-dependent receptor [Xanthomonas sp. AmX2]|uniref:TonB-dependent receptor n=1 Tax=Xanthomonas sp. TaxID=29446 RepID=UPI0019812F3D|nr:TonB-dependent receptor [Xanthomonas sp.]MBN6151007.1 TonB-dependent receptor [Xanthomonas sp.]
MNRRFPHSLLSLSIFSALLLPALAHAQQTAAASPTTTDLDAVTVTALRQSLETAQNIKQSSDMIVDSIVAEDIGKLPDNSVADALQRITGVQIAQGSQGETAGVVIRGLPNVISTLNGREIFSASGRGYAFQNLPATAVKTLSVYKTSEASLPLGGIAGLVDIQLRRPFDFDGPQVAATYDLTHSNYGGEHDPNASLLLSNRWDTGAGEFGALVNLGYMATEYAYDAVWADTPRVLTDGSGTALRTEEGNLISAPNGFGTAYNDGNRRRGAFNYALQWKPNDSTEVYLEGLYDYVRDSYGQAYFFSFPTSVIDPAAISVSDTCYANQLTPQQDPLYSGQTICDASSGRWTGDNYSATSMQAHKQRGQDIQNALGVKWDGDQLHLSSELSRTSGYYRDRNFIIDTYLQGPLTTVWEGNAGSHTNWYLEGDPALNPANFYLAGLFQTWSYTYGEENAWHGDGRFDFIDGPIASLQFGLRYADRNALARGSVERSTPPPGGQGSTAAPNPANQVPVRFPGADVLCTKGSNAAMKQDWLAPCYSYLIQNADALRALYGLPAGLAGENPGRYFDIGEKKLAGYLQAKYDLELSDTVRVDGLIGVRAEKVRRDLNAFEFDAATSVYSALSEKTSDVNVLPNASAVFHFGSDWQLRASAAKTLSYPDFGALNPSLSLNPGTINRAGQAAGGNPDLTPIESKNYDMSLEWYFSPVGSASVGVFYRDIDGYIQTYITETVIGGEDYLLSSPQSAGSGHLQGVEAAWQQTFDFLPGAWSGLGAQFNYTYIDGDTEAPATVGGPMVTRPLQNVSKTNYNAVLFYENFGLSARLAYGYRSRYIASFTQDTVAGNEDHVVPANSLDFSVSYDLNRHATLVFSATNLLDDNFHQYWGSGTSRPRDIRFQDKTFGLGVRLKL